MIESVTVCPVCGCLIHVHDDGTLYAHGVWRDGLVALHGELIWCAGSDKPAPIVQFVPNTIHIVEGA